MLIIHALLLDKQIWSPNWRNNNCVLDVNGMRNRYVRTICSCAKYYKLSILL